LPFTSADVIVNATIPCNPACVWGTCFEGACVCFDGYTGSVCNQLGAKYLDCAPQSTRFGMCLNGLPDWTTEVIIFVFFINNFCFEFDSTEKKNKKRSHLLTFINALENGFFQKPSLAKNGPIGIRTTFN
jgi:hypothetical protein